MDDIEPGDGFYDDQDANKGLNGRLFLMMTDQRALEELQSLFDSWKCTPQTSFSSGLAPLKKVFENLREVRPWDVRDRLVDTGLLKDWEQRKQFGQTTVSFEAELWYRDDPSRRQKAARQIRDLVRELGGHIVTECVIQDIAYHAMLGQIDISHVQELFDRPEARLELALFRCDDVMFFRPVGQCAVLVENGTDEVISAQSLVPKHRTEVSVR